MDVMEDGPKEPCPTWSQPHMNKNQLTHTKLLTNLANTTEKELLALAEADMSQLKQTAQAKCKLMLLPIPSLFWLKLTKLSSNHTLEESSQQAVELTLTMLFSW